MQYKGSRFTRIIPNFVVQAVQIDEVSNCRKVLAGAFMGRSSMMKHL